MKRARDPDTIRAAMASRDLTHSELATLAGCAKGMVSRILGGHAIQHDLALRLSRILRGGVDDLFVDAASIVEQPNAQHSAVA